MCHSAHVEVIESIREPVLSSVLPRQSCFCFCYSVNSRLAGLQASGWFLYLLSYHRSSGITGVHQMGLQVCVRWDYRCMPAGITSDVHQVWLQLYTCWDYRCASVGITDVHQLGLQMCASWDYKWCAPGLVTDVHMLGLQVCTSWDYRCALEHLSFKSKFWESNSGVWIAQLLLAEMSLSSGLLFQANTVRLWRNLLLPNHS